MQTSTAPAIANANSAMANLEPLADSMGMNHGAEFIRNFNGMQASEADSMMSICARL
jgi:hypothetical protein